MAQILKARTAQKPLLVSGPLIKPIQDGRKTETRRLTGLKNINLNPTRFSFQKVEYLDRSGEFWGVFLDCETGEDVTIKSPYGGPGTVLWVRENWYTHKHRDDQKPRNLPSKEFTKPGYMADGDKPDWAGKTRPAIHIPRWLSRIELINQETTLEPLAAITEEGAKAEGVPMSGPVLATKKDPYRFAFFSTFTKLNGPGIVEFNPWVWVVKFTLKKS